MAKTQDAAKATAPAKPEFPPVAGRPGFVHIAWTDEDGKHTIRGSRKLDDGTRGKLETLATFKGVTIPFPATRQALAEFCKDASYQLPGGQVVVGEAAVAASRIKHAFESVRGDARNRLLEGESLDAAMYQAMLNAKTTVGGSGKVEPLSEEAFRKLSPAEQIAQLKARGLLK